MPVISVSVDQCVVASVVTDGFDVLSASVSGTRIEDELAHLEFSGGEHRDTTEPKHLIWVNSLLVKLGQTISVSLLASGPMSHPGKTIEELFPGAEPSEPIEFTAKEEIISLLRQRPQFREKYSFRYSSSIGTSYAGTTNSEDHGFSFGLLWNSFHPERARLSLHSYTIVTGNPAAS